MSRIRTTLKMRLLADASRPMPDHPECGAGASRAQLRV